MPGIGIGIDNIGVGGSGDTGAQPIQLGDVNGLSIQNPLTQQVDVTWGEDPPLHPYGFDVILRNEVYDELGMQNVGGSPAQFFGVQLGAQVHADIKTIDGGDPNYIASPGVSTGSLIVS